MRFWVAVLLRCCRAREKTHSLALSPRGRMKKADLLPLGRGRAGGGGGSVPEKKAKMVPGIFYGI